MDTSQCKQHFPSAYYESSPTCTGGLSLFLQLQKGGDSRSVRRVCLPHSAACLPYLYILGRGWSSFSSLSTDPPFPSYVALNPKHSTSVLSCLHLGPNEETPPMSPALFTGESSLTLKLVYLERQQTLIWSVCNNLGPSNWMRGHE